MAHSEHPELEQLENEIKEMLESIAALKGSQYETALRIVFSARNLYLAQLLVIQRKSCGCENCESLQKNLLQTTNEMVDDIEGYMVASLCLRSKPPFAGMVTMQQDFKNDLRMLIAKQNECNTKKVTK